MLLLLAWGGRAAAGADQAEPGQHLADWRFGHHEIEDLGDEGLSLYVNLRNLGKRSRETVALYVLEEDRTSPGEKELPILDLTKQTSRQKVTIVDLTLPRPEMLDGKDRFLLVVTVSGVPTDALLVDGAAFSKGHGGARDGARSPGD